MKQYVADVIYKKAYRMSIWADSEEEATERAQLEAPEIIARDMAKLMHIEWEVYGISKMIPIEEIDR